MKTHTWIKRIAQSAGKRGWPMQTIRSDEGLTLVMSALKLLTVATVGYQLSYQYKITLKFA